MKSVDCSFLVVNLVVVIFSILSILIPVSIAIISIQDYCESFPDNLKPVICILKEQKNLVSSTSRPSTTRRYGWHRPSPGEGWGGWGEESESESEEDSQCNCDLTCYPPSSSSASAMTTSSEEDMNVKCKPCGNHCDVTMATSPKCSCAALGSGLAPKRRSFYDLKETGLDPALDMEILEGEVGLEWESETKSLLSPLLMMDEKDGDGDRARAASRSSKCSCTVTCAQTSAMNEIPFCIFNITDLQTSRDRRPVNCECCKSKAAENTDYPDFVCICQRV